jgi:DNA-binding transcriptional LysR family regulator
MMPAGRNAVDRLTLMETFVCVVETGSFSAAARRLELGQPAVSKAVAQLEERLGARLLLRSTRGLMPTEAGQNYYQGALKTIAQANEADDLARGVGAGLSGRLRVCAGVTFARLHVVPLMKQFLNTHPELSIDIVLDDRHIDLMEHGIDVALRMGALSDSSMTARRIAQCRRMVLGTPAYFADAGEPQTPSDLEAHQAIIHGNDGGGAWRFARGGVEESVTLSGRMRVTAAEGARAAVLSDAGLAVASEWMFAPELASGAVREVLADWRLPVMDLWAVYPSGRLASAKARTFVEFVQSALTAQAPQESQPAP